MVSVCCRAIIFVEDCIDQYYVCSKCHRPARAKFVQGIMDDFERRNARKSEGVTEIA